MSPLLTTAQLDALRAVGNRGLDSSATIERPTQIETDFGSKESFTQVATGVPCWVRATAVVGSLSSVAMREAVIGTFRIHFEVGTDVRPADKVTVDGASFTVIDVNTENTIQVFTTAMARRVE